jgi:hypothetical protein
MRSFESDELKAKEKKEHIMAGHPVLSKCRPFISAKQKELKTSSNVVKDII